MMPASMAFHMPTQIIFGVGEVARVGQLGRLLGRRALVVSTPGLPHLDRIVSLLKQAGVDGLPYTLTQPNPLARDLDRAGALAREEGCDLVVGVGGGSSIDTAKGAALMAMNEGSIWEYSIECEGQPREAQGALPKIAIPTTAGTGSEVNSIAVIGNAQTRQKGPVRSLHNFPAYAVIDPELTISMPSHVSASTGFDALTHAFERYMQPRYHPFVDLMAEGVIATVLECLPKVLADPEDIELRCRMAWSATQAALCVNARLSESGLHIFGLPISAIKDVPHGVALASMLPAILADIAPSFPRQVARLAEMAGADPTGLSQEESAALCLRATEDWLESIGMTYRLSELGCDEHDCREMAAVVNMDRLAASYPLELDATGVLERYLSRL
jgi:alcohol dehydrogenase class IV